MHPSRSFAGAHPLAFLGEMVGDQIPHPNSKLGTTSYARSIFTEFSTTSLFGLSWRLRGSLVILSTTF